MGKGRGFQLSNELFSRLVHPMNAGESVFCGHKTSKRQSRSVMSHLQGRTRGPLRALQRAGSSWQPPVLCPCPTVQSLQEERCFGGCQKCPCRCLGKGRVWECTACGAVGSSPLGCFCSVQPGARVSRVFRQTCFRASATCCREVAEPSC